MQVETIILGVVSLAVTIWQLSFFYSKAKQTLPLLWAQAKEFFTK